MFQVLPKDVGDDDDQPWTGFNWQRAMAIFRDYLAAVSRGNTAEIATLREQHAARFVWDSTILSQTKNVQLCSQMFQALQPTDQKGISTAELAAGLAVILPDGIQLPFILERTGVAYSWFVDDGNNQWYSAWRTDFTRGWDLGPVHAAPPGEWPANPPSPRAGSGKGRAGVAAGGAVAPGAVAPGAVAPGATEETGAAAVLPALPRLAPEPPRRGARRPPLRAHGAGGTFRRAGDKRPAAPADDKRDRLVQEHNEQLASMLVQLLQNKDSLEYSSLLRYY